MKAKKVVITKKNSTEIIELEDCIVGLDIYICEVFGRSVVNITKDDKSYQFDIKSLFATALGLYAQTNNDFNIKIILQ